MTATTPKPIVPPEVTAFVAGLRLESVFQGLLTGIPEVFPEAMGIECEVDPGLEDEGVDPIVVMNVALPHTESIEPTPMSRWIEWVLPRYLGRDLYHFTPNFYHLPPGGP